MLCIFNIITIQLRKIKRVSLRLPKGFGKNYFTLRAITATVNQISINANTSRVQNLHMSHLNSDELDNEEVDEELETLCTLELSQKPCHCNCYFLKYTKKILKLCPEQNHYYKYFKSLNNSISPPILLLNI